MNNPIADLHVHSWYSDGTLAPEALLAEAAAKNVGLLAVTDHDILEGARELLRLGAGGAVRCISGVELTCLQNGVCCHVLGYGMDLDAPEFVAFAARNRAELERVNTNLVGKMAADFRGVNLEDYTAYTYDRAKGGWKTLHYLMDKGIAASFWEALAFYETYNCTFGQVAFASVGEACRQIHRAGGKAVLAHPCKTIKAMDMTAFEEALRALIACGLDGIECYYPGQPESITGLCLSVCQEKGLITTCGSDSHGAFAVENTPMGIMPVGMERIKL